MVTSPAYVTLFFNGVLALDHVAPWGPLMAIHIAQYTPHDAEARSPCRTTGSASASAKLWARRLTNVVDQPDK